jgi:hypothetical protein
MAATTPALGGTTMAQVKNPDGYEETVEYRGGMRELADGTVVVDLVVAGAKRKFALHWENITTAQRATILTAYATVDDGSATLTAPTGSSYTVMRDMGSPTLDFTAQINSAGDLVWTGSMFLREQ